MRNPSHDERISSFLDDALPAAERAAFEAELRDSSELQLQVAELRQLRADVALLPRYSVRKGFAQRVVAAAVAAKADQDANITPAVKGKPVRLKTMGRGVVTGLAIAASIAILMISLPWLNFGGNDPVKIAVNDNQNNASTVGTENNAIAAESKPFTIALASQPGKDEAMVIRLRAPKDAKVGKALKDALAQQGILKRQPSETQTLADEVGKAFRDQVTSQDTIRAIDGLYVEISRDELELALSTIATPESKLEFAPGQLVAVRMPKPVEGSNTAAAEDIGSQKAAVPSPAAAGDFMQEINPRMFRLPKEAPKSIAPVAPHNVDGKAKVRVLILIEAAE